MSRKVAISPDGTMYIYTKIDAENMTQNMKTNKSIDARSCLAIMRHVAVPKQDANVIILPSKEFVGSTKAVESYGSSHK